MNAISTRVNGQPDYRPASQARAAWREEMLDQLLNQMRRRHESAPPPAAPAREPAKTGKGYYIDLYV
ncbi:MAG: hypothetical protein LBV70_02855 [Candidatus Adiutrix sp.]|jgi:hypothetical protein|nr:hypothetical protein [Candidatus Adiutrix sp.]